MMVPHHGREPWTWREDWAAGRITGTTGSVAKALWLFVLVWNGFTWPVAWLFLKERAQEPGIYLVLPFRPSECCSSSWRSAASWILGLGPTRRIPRAQITDVRSEVVGRGMRSPGK